jgi:hypothetical protein
MLWGLGGSVLSVLGFVAWGLFEQYNGCLAELRGDLKRFNEVSDTFVKKESMQRLREQVRGHMKEMQAVAALKSRFESELRASEKAREEIGRELLRLRERLAFVEGQRSAGARREAAQGDKEEGDGTR